MFCSSCCCTKTGFHRFPPCLGSSPFASNPHCTKELMGDHFSPQVSTHSLGYPHEGNQTQFSSMLSHVWLVPRTCPTYLLGLLRNLLISFIAVLNQVVALPAMPTQRFLFILMVQSGKRQVRLTPFGYEPHASPWRLPPTVNSETLQVNSSKDLSVGLLRSLHDETAIK